MPPIALFDQKLLLALPFWNQTRAFYGDEVRGLFPYTDILTPQGITLEDGSLVRIEKFSRLPCRRRAYFLKYAGADVSRTGEAAPSINSVNSRVSDVRSN